MHDPQIESRRRQLVCGGCQAMKLVSMFTWARKCSRMTNVMVSNMTHTHISLYGPFCPWRQSSPYMEIRAHTYTQSRA